ncbi:restriction endonuclease subunit S [Mycoplasma sp. Ms02]|uniref:restriction endonuclease subunit S n=1 Tax=Mycoplasma sp. Ms02 TaxID=353851 RepID=UPI001C8AA35A|nr:restriction endonuclease subunit S [Mycoplasma sp. Ms02]QZE12178.1 restriction endonuclease subunit S [Mycoplasma sp. Ms02]
MRERERERGNQPQIRFQSFKEEWKSKRWSDITKRVSLISSDLELQKIDTEDIEKGGINLVSNFEIKKDQRQGVLFKKGQLVYSKLNPHLQKVISPNFDGIAYGNFWVFDPIGNNPGFILFLMISPEWKKVANIKHGSSLVYSNIKLISQSHFFITSDIVEQKQISNIFNSLNTQIVKRKKLRFLLDDFFENIKRKMYCKQELKLPYFTFSNSTKKEYWELIKIGDILKRSNEKNNNGRINIVFTNSAKDGIVIQNQYFNNNIFKHSDKRSYYVVKPNDFVYNPTISSKAPAGSFKMNKTETTGLVSPLYSVWHPKNVNYTFLNHFFSNNYWHKHVLKYSNIGVRASVIQISDSDFQRMLIPICSEQEQERIAKLLNYLEKLIILKQKEIKLLSMLKDTLLMKMYM